MKLQGEEKELYDAAEDWISWSIKVENGLCELYLPKLEVLRNFMEAVQSYITSKQQDNGDFTW